MKTDSPITLVLRFFLLAILAASPAAAQNPMDSISFFRYLEPFRMTFILPVEGPTASLLNPARLADAERGYVQYGSWSGGEVRAGALSGGFGIRRRLYLGAFLSTVGGEFTHTNAVIIQNRFGGQVAYRHPLDEEGRGSFTLGIGEATRYMNSMYVFKTRSHTVDLGATFVPSAYPGGWRLDFGWALRDLLPSTETVQAWSNGGFDSSARVDFAPWMTLASLSAESPAKRWKLFGEAAAGKDYEPSFRDTPLPGLSAGGLRWYLPRAGLRYQPISFASMELMRLWNRYWAGGATFGTGSWLPLRGEAVFRLANGPYREYMLPDESGWSMSWNLRILW